MTAASEDVGDRIRELFATSLRFEGAAWERDGGVPASAFARLADIGVFAAVWPEGGRGGGRIDVAALLIRETGLASAGAGIAVSAHTEGYFRALARCAYGADVWAPALAGEAIGAMAITEAAGGSSPSNCETVAERCGDGWVLRRSKHYVSNMRAATDCVVFARTARRSKLSDFTFFIVPTAAPGVTVDPHRQVSARASATAKVALDCVQIGDERRVGALGSGLALLLEFLSAERMMAAAGALGVAELCFEMALAFAGKRRTAQGRLIQQQSIAHRLAALATSIAAGRALLAERLAGAAAGQLRPAQAAQTKLMLSRLVCEAADEAVQVLGGRGFTEETPLAQIWRDVRMSRIGGGTDEIALEIIAQGLRPGTLASHPAVAAVERSAE